MLLAKADYKRCFEGYSITDCVVRDKNIFYFVLFSPEETDELGETLKEARTRIVSCFLDKPIQKRWGYVTYSGFQGLHAGASQRPLPQFVGVDRHGSVIAIGSGFKEIESDISLAEAGPLRGYVTKVKTINGFTHICTDAGGLVRRDNRNQWRPLHTHPEARYGFASARRHFRDFDGFHENDIYCVGQYGDIYHFDGERWQRNTLREPLFKGLNSVCCTGDGHVYVAGLSGIWKGRGTSWQLIHHNIQLTITDMVWFQDRVYCTSRYGFWEIINDQVRPCDVPDNIKICSGELSAADGVMLLSGKRGAAYHDGNHWECLFNTSDF